MSTLARKRLALKHARFCFLRVTPPSDGRETEISMKQLQRGLNAVINTSVILKTVGGVLALNTVFESSVTQLRILDLAARLARCQKCYSEGGLDFAPPIDDSCTHGCFKLLLTDSNLGGCHWESELWVECRTEDR